MLASYRYSGYLIVMFVIPNGILFLTEKLNTLNYSTNQLAWFFLKFIAFEISLFIIANIFLLNSLNFPRSNLKRNFNSKIKLIVLVSPFNFNHASSLFFISYLHGHRPRCLATFDIFVSRVTFEYPASY